jgi:hypothetical protein
MGSEDSTGTITDYIELISGGNITVGTIDSARVSVTAVGNINLTTVKAANGNIDIVSTEGSINADSVVADKGTIDIKGKENTKVTSATAEIGKIILTSTFGDVSFGQIRANEVKINASKSINAFGSIYGATMIEAVKISLKADNGKIGTTEQYLIIKYLGEDEEGATPGTITLDTYSKGDTYIKRQNGDIALLKMVSKEGTIYLYVTGCVSKAGDAGDNVVNLKANKVNIMGNGSLGTQEVHLNTEIGALEGIGYTGDIYLNNNGGMTVFGSTGSMNLVNNGDTTIEDMDAIGDIWIDSTGKLIIIAGNKGIGLITGGGAELASGGDMIINNLIAKGTVKLDAQGTIFIDKIESSDKKNINIKANNGIQNISEDEDRVAIIKGGELIIETMEGSIGTMVSPFKSLYRKVLL